MCLIIFFVAISMPACFPGCGTNAHCTYKAEGNTCTCNPGTSGNPYEECSVQGKANTCTPLSCGKGAVCQVAANNIECSCPSGYRGNPYISCEGQLVNNNYAHHLSHRGLSSSNKSTTNFQILTSVLVTLVGKTLCASIRQEVMIANVEKVLLVILLQIVCR